MKRKLVITYDYVTSEVAVDNNDGEGFTEMEVLGLLEFVKMLLIEMRVNNREN